MKRMRLVLLIAIIVFSTIVVPGQAEELNAPARFAVIIDGAVQPIEVTQRLISTKRENGVLVQKYEAKAEITFGITQSGDMRANLPGLTSKSTIQEDQWFLSQAVKWVGTIVYTKHTINGTTAYRPTEYKHKLTVYDSNYSLKSLNAAGGGSGPGYDVTNNNQRGIYSTGIKYLNKTNPASGTVYTKSLSNTRYAFERGSSTSVNSYGTFKYIRISETGQPTHTSPEFEVVLI